jgi:CRP-like cAMP-binding protein
MTMSIDIRSAYLFSTLSDQQIQHILAASHTLKLDDGQSLFETGDPAQRFFLVVAGQVKLFRLSAEGNEKIIDIIQPSNTFAEALMFLAQPAYPVSATALGDTLVMSFDNRRFLELLRGSVDTCLRVMGTMSQRLRGLIKEIDDLTLQSATSRISAMLLRHMQIAASEQFVLHAPKGVLASRLSVKPETFSRILHNLSAQRIIEVNGNRITVRSGSQLRALAHTESLIGLEETAQNPCPLSGAKKV